MDEYPKIGETWKAHERRAATGWFERFCHHPGLDIGPDRDPLNETYRRWLYEKDGDATQMHGVPDCTFATVYASHVLEHLHDPATGLKNWFRILKPGGHLVVLVPHRDRYEKRNRLPSRWNGDHKWFWLPDADQPPCTLSFKRVITEAIPEGELISFGVLDEGFVDPGPDRHSHGEYSIEAVIRKATQ